MRPSVVTTFEHQSLSVGDAADAVLAPKEAARLVALGAERPGFCTPGYRNVRLAQFAGLVNLGGRVLEVLPKVGESTAGESRGTFLRILRLARGVRVFSTGSTGHDLQRHSLLSVFVSKFLDEVSQLVRGGLLRRYQTHTGDLRVVRGRLLLAKQSGTNGMRPDRLACQFDDLTVDNHWNQVLRAALVTVRPWIEGIDDGRRWLELSAAFGEVSLRPDAVSLLDALVPDRQVKHYEPALEWAGMILRLLSPNVRAGLTQAPELLFDMNRLFESAVATVLRRRAGNGEKVTTQEQGRHLAVLDHPSRKRMFRLRPDLVVRDGAIVIAVGDTKWTRVDPTSSGWLVPRESHVYQMHAYSSVYPCEDFCLIYPYHSALAGSTPVAYGFPGVPGREPKLHMACIDIGRDDLPVRCASVGTWFVR